MTTKAKVSRRRWGVLGLALGALAPVASVALQAAAEESVWEARRRVLAKMTTDHGVLINVTSREMPSSPDVLNLGRGATKALERCVSDNADAQIRIECIGMLRAIGDRSALPTLRAALADWEPAVRHEAIRALEDMPHPDSFAPLARLLSRKDEEPSNHYAILSAMGASSSHDAVRLLRAELARRDSDRRAVAFRALWRSRHLMARTTLEGDVAAALAADDPGLVLAATEASAELRSGRLVRPLMPLMHSQDAEIRNKAVYALGRIGDPVATKALVSHLPKVREARMLNNIAFALERLDRGAFYREMEKLAGHRQAVIRLNAAFVLGDVRRPEGLPLLRRALADDSDYVRTSAVVAIGKLGTDDGIGDLEKLADDPNLSIREEAIHALVHLTKGKRADLLHDRLFASPLAKSANGAGLRRRAALELGRHRDARVRDFLVACFESHSCSLADVEAYLRADSDPTTGGRLLLEWARGRTDLTHLLGDLKPAGSASIALSAYQRAMAGRETWWLHHSADLLGAVGGDADKPRLSGNLDAKDTWLRAHVAVASARLGETRADGHLLADLDNLPVVWLPRYARLVAVIAEDRARNRLRPELERRARSSEPDVALAAASVLLAWDPEPAFFRFLDALASPAVADRELAERYVRKNRDEKLTWVMRRALARENRPSVRDRLRVLLDAR